MTWISRYEAEAKAAIADGWRRTDLFPWFWWPPDAGQLRPAAAWVNGAHLSLDGGEPVVCVDVADALHRARVHFATTNPTHPYTEARGGPSVTSEPSPAPVAVEGAAAATPAPRRAGIVWPDALRDRLARAWGIRPDAIPPIPDDAITFAIGVDHGIAPSRSVVIELRSMDQVRPWGPVAPPAEPGDAGDVERARAALRSIIGWSDGYHPGATVGDLAESLEGILPLRLERAGTRRSRMAEAKLKDIREALLDAIPENAAADGWTTYGITRAVITLLRETEREADAARATRDEALDAGERIRKEGAATVERLAAELRSAKGEIERRDNQIADLRSMLATRNGQLANERAAVSEVVEALTSVTVGPCADRTCIDRTSLRGAVDGAIWTIAYQAGRVDQLTDRAVEIEELAILSTRPDPT